MEQCYPQNACQIMQRSYCMTSKGRAWVFHLVGEQLQCPQLKKFLSLLHLLSMLGRPQLEPCLPLLRKTCSREPFTVRIFIRQHVFENVHFFFPIGRSKESHCFFPFRQSDKRISTHPCPRFSSSHSMEGSFYTSQCKIALIACESSWF